ncbi:hypothetical protein P153DRAFT_385644 [Dothidotthia symphoricarpi CBS 119687]|uniref:Uncharacterized protein n=1 Tax=Dothidotthia symphoricarpi CBS 119687 TaxID=1392245 RepID=A0A6A6AEA5_9PLEO|nr:uncharacterized protein P153DRAFT_385644 [Dothidotthia symphoricarpi CBS 119687]KAF2129435.1 hypothetical protein P153DRAFT_385644 [Dothidotthia symphoricarpi CBS 119687]
MSSPATQYVYIPNLVGRQMLRIPVEEVEAEEIISSEDLISMTKSTTTSQPITMKSTSTYSRDSSPSPSMSSVSSYEEKKPNQSPAILTIGIVLFPYQAYDQ